jgi:hypothetical protein
MDRHGWRGWALWLVLFAGADLSIADAAGQPVVTNKLRFRIPYRFDQAALQRLQARELQLFVSMDRGQSWAVRQTIGVQSGRFDFEAPADGEYWFAVKTLDAAGKLHPSGPTIEPGLTVIVDTLVPNLQLLASPAGPGQAQLAWAASDPTLDPSTLKFEYQVAGGDWRELTVPQQAAGQTTWTVVDGGAITLRGTVQDRAGNVGRGSAEVRLDPADERTRRNIPDLRQPIAGRSEPLAMNVPRGSTSPGVEVRPDASMAPIITPAPVPPPRGGDGADSKTAIGPPTLATAPSANRFVTDLPAQRPSIAQDRWPAPSDSVVVPQELPGRSTARHKGSLVNSRRFQLAYQVDQVGPSGVGQVELFITQDDGLKWWKYGDDADRVSPVEVEVPHDGEYGFAVRVRSGVGLAKDAPASGEPPSMVVTVDLTPPSVELFTPQQGQGLALGHVTLRWRVTDPHPQNVQIAVSYSSRPDGPWQPLRDWQADTGLLEWTVDSTMPPEFFVRVQARDHAGNIASAVSNRAIVVDLMKPSARILGVESPPSADRSTDPR